MRLSIFSLIGGLLISLQVWLALSSIAFAAAQGVLASSADIPQYLARAQVSVVRLLVSYTTSVKNAESDTGEQVIQCTGLGVIIDSLSAGAQGQKNWVLTSDKLVSKGDTVPCAQGDPPGKLSNIQVYLNTAYNSQKTLTVSVNIAQTPPVVCEVSTPTCQRGVALFALSDTAPEPNIDLASQLSPQDAHIALGRNGISASLPPSATGSQAATAYKQIDLYRVPQGIVPSGSTNTPSFTVEPGTPLIDNTGKLSGIYVSNTVNDIVPVSQINIFLQSLPFTSSQTRNPVQGGNPVHDNWQAGITDYYQNHNYSAAKTAFAAAAAANSNFLGAQDFEQKAQAAIPTQGSNSNQQTSADHSSPEIDLFGLKVSPWLLSIGGLVVLVLLLVLVSLLLGRSRLRHRQVLRAELVEAERKAAIDAQRIAEAEAAQRNWVQTGPLTTSAAQANAMANRQSGPVPAVTQQTLRCPRCGEVVAADANYCSNCRLVLSPSESGLHLRVRPQVQANAAPPASVAPPPPPPPSAPPAPLVAAGSLVDQPTLPVLPQSAIDQPTLPVLPQSSARAMADQPTTEMQPRSGQDGQGQGESERTLPYAVRQFNGGRLGFVAGTQTNPGIKRKYKPNEDSLFAAQGVMNVNVPVAAQPFGLFVVADGMGGHANGQAASRLAIQTLIEYVLPKLAKGETGPEKVDAQLLLEGIQTANQAVHQQNMDKRADMGTTVTAALIVDGVAYVANVGDSRTYLYREGEGLKKVTNDHSVVASLVEAGIIKPDDIYTHPKRNQIYRSLGEKSAVDIDTFTVPLQEGDKLILCSDGLWDMVRDPKIEDVIKKSPAKNPNATGEALIKAALEGGGEDNVSVIVVHITESAKGAKTKDIQVLAVPEGVEVPKL